MLSRMLHTGNLPSQPSLQLLYGHGGGFFRIVIAALGHRTEGGAGQKLHFAHQGADQTLKYVRQSEAAGEVDARS